MDTGTSIGESSANVFWFLGDVAFKWIPATFVALTSSAAANPATAPITAPVSTYDVVNYLQTASAPSVYDNLYHSWSSYVAFSTFVSLLCAALSIYCFIRIRQIRHFENLKFQAAAHPVAARDISKAQLRWNRILDQAHSDSDQQWRLAILEADILLNELLDTLGYKGETMGDKMRQVERADFNSIDNAWEAHRIRNRIAHEGTAHILSSRETRRVISLYETVFREFRFIE